MNKNESNMEKEFNVEKFVNGYIGIDSKLTIKLSHINDTVENLKKLYKARDGLKKIIESYKSDPDNYMLFTDRISCLLTNMQIDGFNYIDMEKDISVHVHVDADYFKELSNITIKYIEKEYNRVLNDIVIFEKSNSKIFKNIEDIIL